LKTKLVSKVFSKLDFQDPDPIMDTIELVASRDPYEFDFGITTFDGAGTWFKGWFESERELLEYIVTCEPFVNHSDDEAVYNDLRSKLEAFCAENDWSLSEQLFERLNTVFLGDQKIAWWGQFSDELAQGLDGYFAEALTEVAQDCDIEPEQMLKRGLNDEENELLVEKISGING